MLDKQLASDDTCQKHFQENCMARQKYYRDFRDHLKELEAREKLIRVHRRIDKDTELMPLVRWQFRGLEEEQRKAFLFENVVDAKGKQYSMPVTVGTLAATTEIYAIGLMCRAEEIHERWNKAQLSPIEPVKVAAGPVQEMVWTGKELLTGYASGADLHPRV
jgi:4-hydroxy-3-polyprenylbenzoate decarboxylase